MVMVEAPWLQDSVGQPGTQHAQVVHAAVLIEPGVLDGQDGLLHHFGDLVDRQVGAPLFANSPSNCPSRERMRMGSRLVVSQAADVRQPKG